ncbi:hypothetical protein [Amycolatopsis sp. DSM 110486]|uniref:hypothetical protein n=1 Tax=Amycolatopsis sp. DSM 110486 TaxID=2865832 RepID=UPI001C6A562A|nr:hypothetical protein [Amycolatopsis sp. DSM 110486]QYN22505.1 hypothetical protein K1T34_08540 [Amycolatopsis sp. DSM 110486]
MQIDLVDAWAWWAGGSPGLREAYLWGLAVKWWGLLGSLVLLTVTIALVADVAKIPEKHRRRSRATKILRRLTALAIAVLVVVGAVNAVREEARDTGTSTATVLLAGNDGIDWAGAPRWFVLLFAGLVVLALLLWQGHRLRDWVGNTVQKGLTAIATRLAAAFVALAALSFAVLAG